MGYGALLRVRFFPNSTKLLHSTDFVGAVLLCSRSARCAHVHTCILVGNSCEGRHPTLAGDGLVFAIYDVFCHFRRSFCGEEKMFSGREGRIFPCGITWLHVFCRSSLCFRFPPARRSCRIRKGVVALSMCATDVDGSTKSVYAYSSRSSGICSRCCCGLQRQVHVKSGRIRVFNHCTLQMAPWRLSHAR